MRRLLTVFLLAISGHCSAAVPVPWQFAISITTTSTGQLFCMFLVKVSDGQVTESRPLTRADFVRQVQGRAFSPANPDADDLFRKYDVKRCTLPPDSAAMGFLTDCGTLDDLWKLRFWEYPLHSTDNQHAVKGWSERPLNPSQRQMDILNGYGMRFPTDLVIGEEMFRLLHDMGDRNWVVAYRNG